MPTSPYVKVQLSVNAGGVVTVPQTVAGSSTMQLSLESISGLFSVHWVIFGYPPTYPTPAGWTLTGGAGTEIFYDGTVPPLITLRTAAQDWGKWEIRCTGNNGAKNGQANNADMVSELMGWEVLSPALGLREPGVLEGTQFNSIKAWVDPIQQSLRLLDTTSGALMGDVTGPENNNTVVRLTGSAGVVNTPNASWKLTSLIATVGDVITQAANTLSFGNQAVNVAVNVLSQNNMSIRSSAGYVNLIGETGAGNGLFFDGTKTRFRDSGGTEYFRFDFNSPSLQIDSASGTFPATGFIRFKTYASDTTLVSVRNAGGDSPFIIHNGATQRITIGDVGAVAGTDLVVQASFGFTIQSRASAMNFYCAGAGFQFSNYTTGVDNFSIPSVGGGGAALLQFGENVLATLKQKIAVTTNSGAQFSITAQAAKSGGGGNGGVLAIASGAKDGAGADGNFTLSTGAQLQVSLVGATSTWTYASSTVFASAGSMTVSPSGALTLSSGASGTAVNSAGAVLLQPTLGSAALLCRDLGNARVNFQVDITGSAAGSTVFRFGESIVPTIKQDIAVTATNGASMLIIAQAAKAAGAGTGGVLAIAGGAGDGAGLAGGVQLYIGGSTILAEVAIVATNRRLVSLNRAAAITTTEMPANTGDLVMYIGNAATVPTASPVSGGILYCDTGALKYKGTSGTVTTLAAA